MSINANNDYLIVVDSLNIGGKERLALDQAYYLHSIGFKVKIIMLNYATELNLLMSKMDLEFSQVPKIEIVSISGLKYKQFIKLVYLFAKIKKNFVIISHSTKACVLTRLASCIFPKALIIHTMNQSVALSSKKQAFRIAFYSLFSHYLLAGCQPFVDEWKLYVNSSYLKKIFFSRKLITLNRNGLYIPRLLNAINPENNLDDDLERILYLGRVKEWKGTKTFGQISNHVNKNGVKSVLAIPMPLTELQENFFGQFQFPINQIIGKPPTQIPHLDNLVHIYPADYGVNSTFYESISLNVMELLCLGVPSIISENGRSTWPELLDYSMLQDCDWSSLEEIETFLEKLFSISESQKLAGKLLAQKIFNIENNIHGIFRIARESTD
jgi:glycosyltransferase involved in cell wall biosynthesis